ncbi:MAG TPA: nitroreductase family protein [Microlunatus sp.]|nr:nitroreductase family protein [Microlunatus sp.]
MELSEVRRRRRMVRSYDPDAPVPKEALDRILDAGLRVPSAGFTQAVSLLVLDRDDKDRFWATTTDPHGAADRWLRGMLTAPVLVVVWTQPGAYLDRYAEPDKGWTDRDPARWTTPYWYVDAGMAALAMLYAAVDEGLGACFFGAPPDRIPAIRDTYGVPIDHELVGVLSLGTPAEPPRRSRRGRRSASELIHRGRWEGTSGVNS